jgi:hypothetical protein
MIPESPSPDAEDPTGWKTAEALIGLIEDARADMAENHDYYLSARRRRELPRHSRPVLAISRP